MPKFRAEVTEQQMVRITYVIEAADADEALEKFERSEGLTLESEKTEDVLEVTCHGMTEIQED